ncbi:hypothetical protein LCGC14_0288620 [marine sediment metagenome]|uniref:Helicase ATP-binding domain-containing protein n=1 Tax=marine sediment metagenome TaxID=412755 RepID=A0A0F9TTP2_9ZZZZ
MAHNIITVTNTHARFEGPNIYQARTLLSYRQKGYIFTRAYKRGGWDGWVKIMSPSGRFAAGLTPWLAARLHAEGIDVEVVEERPAAPTVDFRLAGLHNSTVFRQHQTEAIEKAEQGERGVVWHPTAAGKTEVLLELARRIGLPGLILVHRKDLMTQTADRAIKTLGLGRGLEDFDKQDVIGVIGDGKWEPRVLTVATFQTLYRRLKGKEGIETWLREEIGQVHVDEAHHLPAKSYERVMANLWSAKWRYGYSATPYKEEDLETFFKVCSWLGPTIHHVGADELAEQGHLVAVDVFMIAMPKNRISWKKWPEAVEYGIISNTVRNSYIVDLARRLNESRSGAVAILVERLEHGTKLAKMLDCPFIAGKQSTKVRQQAYDDVRAGKLNLLVISKIADEGLDIPPLTFLIMAGGGKAPHLTVQRVGRGMRLSEGKERLFCFDFMDRGKYLEGHSKKRLKTYSSQPAYTCSQVEFEEVCP